MKDVKQYLEDRIHKNSVTGCWLWRGCMHSKYGKASINGESYLAHRLAYEAFTGKKIPEGMTIDHLCQNQRCVNPEHMEVVTQEENSRRGSSLKPLTYNSWRGRPKRRCNMKFKKFVKETGKSIKGAAEELGVSTMTIRRLLESKRKDETALKIYDWSNGEVTPNDLYLPSNEVSDITTQERKKQ